MELCYSPKLWIGYSLTTPKEWMHQGKNEIEVLELLKPRQHILKGINHPILDSLQKDRQF